MSRRPATFTQADIARALRAIKQADVKMVVEISPNGTIRIVPADQGLTCADEAETLDAELQRFRGRNGYGESQRRP